MTGVEVSISKDEQPNPPYPDLARGTRGDHIYVKVTRDKSKPAITGLFLARSKEAKTVEFMLGMAGMTGNINQTRQGKKGTFLYLVWRTQVF